MTSSLRIALSNFSGRLRTTLSSGMLGTVLIANGLAGFAVTFYSTPLFAASSASTSPKYSSPRHSTLAHFGKITPSQEARLLADWVAHTHDNGTAKFIIVDKRNAKVYVFDAAAKLRGASPILLGAARGDDSVPGIGLKPLSEVRPEERTTPAGRFVGEPGRNLKGEDIVWVDYDAAVSMHRVRATNPVERRLQRLATPTIDDNRISYGCINVPVAFYEGYVKPASTKGVIVYVLPEVKTLQQVFGSLDIGTGHKTR